MRSFQVTVACVAVLLCVTVMPIGSILSDVSDVLAKALDTRMGILKTRRNIIKKLNRIVDNTKKENRDYAGYTNTVIKELAELNASRVAADIVIGGLINDVEEGIRQVDVLLAMTSHTGPSFCSNSSDISYLTKTQGSVSSTITDLERRHEKSDDHLESVPADVGRLQEVLGVQGHELTRTEGVIREAEAVMDHLEERLRNLNTGVAPLPQVTCNRDWQGFGGRCYKILACRAYCSVDTSRSLCLEWGSKLTKVHSKAHSVWLRAAASDMAIFTGGNDRKVEGQWVWANGEDVNDGFTDWSEGMQYSHDGDHHDCLVMDANNLGRWTDLECGRLFRDVVYVCEAPAPGGA